VKLYEFTCTHCGRDFDSITSLCPACSRPAKRAYRTAPGYVTRGLVKRFDKILGAELSDRGLSDLPKLKDFSDAEPRASFPMMTGPTASANQSPVTPGWGRGALNKLNEGLGTHFSPPATFEAGDSHPLPTEQAEVGPSRDYVRKHTQIIARIDSHGERIG
jgi:hypothetical protein